MTTLAFALRHWKIILAGLGVAILTGSLIAEKLYSARLETKVERLTGQLASERAAHDATLASVAVLTTALEKKNAESQARADAFAKARAEAAQRVQKAERDYAVTQRRIDALRAAVGKNDGNQCAVPKEVLDALP